ncbi:flavin reductase family protein [Pseudonocardia sp. ICBG601]|uniref:flavin reductase family protein n=1 Tax=Pseudonocardia sp. ICBG601 TaxID=2846759 RepID=UPI0027E34EEC|nr:flavin reductase family protein [Pseudonocardia sp. ICBG601]
MSIDPIRFREVLGAFCSGITVVTALDADGAPLGPTCRSFSSLSSDPPLRPGG